MRSACEAHLLTGHTDASIAGLLGVSEDSVRWFAALYLDVGVPAAPPNSSRARTGGCARPGAPWFDRLAKWVALCGNADAVQSFFEIVNVRSLSEILEAQSQILQVADAQRLRALRGLELETDKVP